MARIRSIKPEFWSSEQIMECSTNARLLFIGLWNFCDDAGRMPLKARQIKAQVFPGDNFSSENILGMIGELKSHQLLQVYIVDKQSFICITGWHHQRIDKPQPAKYPEPPDQTSTNVPRTLPPDRKGKERKGKEGKEGKGERTRARASNPNDSHLTEIPEHMIRMARVSKLDDLTVTRPLREWAKQEAPDVTLDEALEEFRDYCLAKDPKFKDYMAAFRNSLRRTEARAQGRNGSKPSLMETIDRIGAEDGE